MHRLSLTEHAANGLVHVNTGNERFQNDVGFFTLNLEISQTTSMDCTKARAARVARLFFLIPPITSLFSGARVLAVVVVVS